MLRTRHEEYEQFSDGLPFVFQGEIKRTRFTLSPQNNWHENLEIQFCTGGHGTILLNGEAYDFSPNDMVVVNSNVLHYTATDTEVLYDCLIISTAFCRQMGMDPRTLFFSPFLRESAPIDLFRRLRCLYSDSSVPFRTAKLNQLILELLLCLVEGERLPCAVPPSQNKKFELVTHTISYLREQYAHKITLDEIAGTLLCDKYTLCKDFKKLTGQTIVEHLNNYRCIKATDYLAAGYSVTDTALLCGFENLSFFVKTFKKYMGKLPSAYKR